MNSRERFDMFVSMKIRKPEEDIEVIKLLVNKLIDALYYPVEGDTVGMVDEERLNEFNIDKEDVNWGDLSCVEVEKVDDSYNVLIEEAGDAPSLCEYIERFMFSYGWKVNVREEW